MILSKIKSILSHKSNRIMYMILILIVFLCLSVLFMFHKTTGTLLTHSSNLIKGEWIVITVSNSQNKSDLWLLNTKTQIKQKILNNRDVVVAGKVNTNGDTLLYSDAIGTNPWDIFRLNISTKEVYQITNDPLGQFNLNFGDEKGNIIFAKSGDKNSPVPKISKIDVVKKEGKTFEFGSDIAVQDFYISKNKIIALTFSYNEFITKRFKEQNDSLKIKYTIMEMDTNGGEKKELAKISAVRLDSISLSKSGKFIILGGQGVKNNEKGFYKLVVNGNKVSTLITQEQLKKTNKIMEISQPYISCLSANEENIYFVAVPIGTHEANFMGLTTYPNSLYCYNLKQNKLSEIFKVPGTFIPSISFTYQ